MIHILIRKEKKMKPLTLESLRFCSESFGQASLYATILLRKKF